MPKQLHLFGVRHHGPGSARAVLRALDAVQPQCVLIEGPPDADEILASAAHLGMQPPVAILVYQADDAKQAVFYPFAAFSPEWCAIRWALEHGVPVRFMDLPQSHRLAAAQSPVSEAPVSEASPDDSPSAESPPQPADPDAQAPPSPGKGQAPPVDGSPDDSWKFPLRLDPLHALARAAGFDDGERWWEHTFEARRQVDTEVFAAIREAMGALREDAASRAEAPSHPRAAQFEQLEPRREAWMRRTIRQAQREYDNLAAICGAWHVPALTEDAIKQVKSADDALLKALPKVKTVATWIPWTYDRLTVASGYGAGVHSPGWYEHLWRGDAHLLESWLTRVGRLLREHDIDCSSAHVIEATRLATSLAAMRGRPLADLSDIADACRAIFCFDSDLAMRLIAKRLLVGERLGQVPDDTALVPLQQDLQVQQKRLRLKPEALDRLLDLDLRNETDLRRSELLHRLRLLGIDWGTPQPSRSGKGTFHEIWQLRWEPEFLVRLIELGIWGSTIEAAAAGYTCHQADEASDLEQLTRLLGDLMLANLPTAVAALMDRVLSTAAVAADVAKLMDALPPLAELHRYGNVRQTDKQLVRRAIDGVLPRILIGLGGAVASLNDDAARGMLKRIERTHEAVQLLDATDAADYRACLVRVADQPAVHGLLRGRATRILFDAGDFTSGDVAGRMSLMLSRGADPPQAAAWVEGFLSTSGLVLLHHAELLAVIDEWMCSILADVFNEQVPLLRRTFSTFAPAERRQIGERLRAGPGQPSARAAARTDDLDPARAARVLPILRTILGTGSEETPS